jgi:hypothetical protein
MEVVVAGVELLHLVDRAFAVTGAGFSQWPDPHAHRSPADDEYSRVTDAAKWRIVGARGDAWLNALGEAALAGIERDTTARWVSQPGPWISRTDRAVPHRRGALPLVIARSAIDDVPDAGVTLGVGDPAVWVAGLPECGCDACDSGSQYDLDELDRIVLGVVAGTFRHLTSGERHITQFDPYGWRASGSFGRREVDAVLANPRGWHQLAGAAWAKD